MLRLQTETGWWLVTHPEHARLAGAFAAKWGNELFLAPEPRERVLRGISRHDNGWAARDASPQITRQGKPSAFSTELVGKYSAFEEIDLPDYLAVRDRAVRAVAAEDAYAALLIGMHTYSLLSEHADRSTIATDQLPLLDQFLERQRVFQDTLRQQIADDAGIEPEQKTAVAIADQFHLLQATDNLSLLACVDFRAPAHLLHALPTRNGDRVRVKVESPRSRHFVLDPYPFSESPLTFVFPARHVEGKLFASSEELRRKFDGTAETAVSVTVSGH